MSIALAADWTEVAASEHDRRMAAINGRPSPPSKQELEARREREAQRAAEQEEARLRKRTATRTELHVSDRAEVEHAKIVQAIADTNDQTDTFVAEHQERFAPLKAEFDEIERRQLAASLAREPHDEILEARRQAVLSQMREANADLKTKCDAQNALLETLEQERIACSKKITRPIVGGNLLTFGRPDLVIAMKVAQSASAWARARRASVCEKLERMPSDSFLRAELAAAESEVSRTAAAEQVANQACIDE